MNGLFNQGAASSSPPSVRGIGSLIGRPNQKESVMSYFEKRPPAFVDPS